MPNSTNQRPRSARCFNTVAAAFAGLISMCLSVACNSSDDDPSRTGSESHFIRCSETTACEVGVCVDGYCEVDGERVRVDSNDDDPADDSDDSTDDTQDGTSSDDERDSSDGSSNSEAGASSTGGASTEGGGAASSSDDTAADDDIASDDSGSDDPASGEAGIQDPPSSRDDDAGATAEPGGEAGGAATGTEVDPPAVMIETLTPCPDAAPSDSEGCDELGLECTYGNDPRGVRCRTRAVCTFGGWTVEQPSCPALVDLGDCPLPVMELSGTACEPNAHCSNGDSRCQCGNCYIESYEICEGGFCDTVGEVICGETPVWHCDQQVQMGCSLDAPDIGAPCDDSEPSCNYFDPVCGEDIHTACFLGRISALPPLGYGEDCEGQLVASEEFCPAEPPEPQTPCSRGFRDPPSLSCDYGSCERYQCGGQVWLGGILNEPECTDCGLLDAACDEDSPCCNGFYCQTGGCASLQVCGNGVVDPAETCDDDNLEDGDGCSSQCQIEPDSL